MKILSQSVQNNIDEYESRRLMMVHFGGNILACYVHMTTVLYSWKIVQT